MSFAAKCLLVAGWWTFTALAVTATDNSFARKRSGDYVVLLHGMGRTALSMKRLEWSLAGRGYRVVNVSYPSTRLPVERLANECLDAILRERVSDPSVKIHFVTHSLGGIVLRYYLANHELANLGRAVMLAPPNQGSEVADRLGSNFLYRHFTGPSGQQLGTGDNDLPRQLGPANFEVGIIAGDRSLNPVFSWLLPGPDDGKVSVESTKLEGAQGFLVTHQTHTWMMWRQSVIRQIVAFLESGRFLRS